MPTYKIPFNKPSLCGSEMQYMAQAVENSHISGWRIHKEMSPVLAGKTRRAEGAADDFLHPCPGDGGFAAGISVR